MIAVRRTGALPRPVLEFANPFQTTGAAVALGAAAVYFAIRRPMRGTAASTCFLPEGRSYS